MKNLLLFGAIIAAAVYFLSIGSLTMIAALLLMILVHEFGHWVVARSLGFEVQTFSIGFGSSPRLRLGKFWGTEFQITPWLAGGFVSINPADDSFRLAAAWKRIAVLVAGVVMNVLSAGVILFLMFATMGQQERIEAPNTVHIGALAQDPAIAAKAGLQPGDRVVSVDGTVIATVKDLSDALARGKGRAVTMVVERSGQNMTFTLTPNEQGRIGVQLGVKYKFVYHKMGVVEAAGKSVTGTVDGVVMIGKGLGMMLGIVEKPANLPAGASDVRGIVAIVQMGDVAWENGIYTFLMLVVMVSFNLAVFNILPIPMLDGGHITFILIEKLIGRPVPVRIQNFVSILALFGLLSLFFLGLFNDIVRPMKLK